MGHHQLSRGSSTYTTRPAGYWGTISCREAAPLTRAADPRQLVGAHSNALPLAALGHLVFYMGVTVLSVKLDTSKGMAVTILAIQIKDQALPADLMHETLTYLLEVRPLPHLSACIYQYRSVNIN